jgi:prophage regulatory protein
MVIRFLREREVCVAMGWSRSQLWKQIGLGQFPKPVKTSPGLNGWPENEVAEAQQTRIAARDAGGATHAAA